jgi:hypothetical protein
MRTTLSRWGIILLNLAILAAVQYGVYTIFLRKAAKPEEEIYTVDLKEIENAWKSDVRVPDPDELTGPIREAFGADREIEGPIEGPVEDLEEDGPKYLGPLVVVGVVYAPQRPAVVLQVQDGRQHFIPGEDLPDGSVLESVEQVDPAAHKYRIHVRKDEKTEVIDFEGKPL